MLRCSCWLARWANFLARRGIGMTLLLIVNVIHPLVHGTPLDSGTWDQALVVINSWAYADATVPR